MKKKIIIFLLILFVLTSSIYAKGMKEQEVKYKGVEGKITVYVSGPEKMLQILEKTFEEKYGDVIDIYHSGCGPLRQKIWAEAEANNIHADVFWGSNPLIYYALKEKGLLQEYTSKEWNNLKPEFQTENKCFTLVSTRYPIIVYNNKLSKNEAPQSYAALTNPKWKNKIAYTDISQSSTAFALTTALWDLNGRDMSFFKGIKANNALIVPKTKSVVDKIQSGEIEAGITAFDAIFRLNKKAKKEGYTSHLAAMWPKEGAIQMDRPIAIIKNNARFEKNQKIAENFVDFILSKKAQAIMLKFGFTSIRKDLPQVKGVPRNLKPLVIDWKDAEKSEPEIRKQFKKVMLGN